MRLAKCFAAWQRELEDEPEVWSLLDCQSGAWWINRAGRRQFVPELPNAVVPFALVERTMHPEDVERVHDAVSRTIKLQEKQVVEFRSLRKPGAVTQVLLRMRSPSCRWCGRDACSIVMGLSRLPDPA